MKVAILGALGFLGRNLAHSLVLQGHEVTGFVLHAPAVQPAGYLCLPISSLSDKSISSSDRYDVVINLAARRSTKSNPLTDSKVREFTFEIPMDFILRAGNRGTLILNASTYIQNFEGQDGKTVDSYGAAKQQLSHFLAQESEDKGFRTLDLFLFTIYGQGDRQTHLVPSLISAAKKGEGISLTPGDQLLSLTYIDDVVRNFSAMVTNRDEFSYRRHFMWSEEYVTVRHLVEVLEKISEVKIDCLWGERPYAGHEMFEPWHIPMKQTPGFDARVSLEQGLSELWSLT
jgi:CDP-3, 6-dideoxy-D-glycero-L-glycero-4-hexulose-4-reductase